MAVRRATEDDVLAIAQLAATGWRNAYRGLHVAERAGKVVGYAQHGPADDTTHEVYAIYVDPAMLGQSIGWALWRKVERDARDGENSAIELWVLDGNRLGIDWYNRQGGQVVGRREIELADGSHTELRYRSDLKAG